MEKLGDAINKLIVDTWGGLVAFWALVVAASFKFFAFLGECMAEGAIIKQTNNMLPVIKRQIKEEMLPIKQDVAELKELIPAYKKEKHAIEGELKAIKRVIMDDDKEILRDLKSLLEKSHEKDN